MTYAAVTIDGFKGLDLSDPMDVPLNGAVDLLNVDLDQRGKVRTRDGTSQVSGTSLGTGVYTFMVPMGSELVLVRSDAGTQRIDSMSSGGVLTSKGSFAASAVISTAALGTPSAALTYFASGAGTLLQKYNATTGTVSASVGEPTFIAVSPTDNRLAQARFDVAGDSPTGANGSPSTVFFSDPGDPDTYSANNYVHLRPGDGDVITAMGTWREMLFVFKNSMLFVFYGTSTDSTGNPVFNYRAVSLPSPMYPGPAEQLAAPGPDGMYFVASDGIYRTTGGPPERITDALAPIWDRLGPFVPTSLVMEINWAGDRLFCRFKTASGERFLVWDRRDWLVWTAANISGPPVLWSPGGTPNVYLAVAGEIHRYNSAVTTDDGTAISWHWQGGVSDLGDPAEKVVRETWLWGTGSPTVSVLTDHGTTDSLAAAVTLGVSPAVSDAPHRIAYSGNLFSLKLSGTTAATINRANYHLRERRLAGAKS